MQHRLWQRRRITMEKSSAILKTFFNRKKQLSSAYSLRALARDIRVSPSFLSEVMSGKKRLSLDRLDLVTKVLDIDPEAAMDLRREYVPDQVRASVSAVKKKRPPKPEQEFVNLSRKHFGILRHWYYFAILDLTTCADFGGTLEEIARRLGLHPETAGVAVRELLEQGLLLEDGGRLKKTHDSIRLASATPRSELANYHEKLLEKARYELKSKLNEEDWNRRMIAGITFSADPQKIAAAKKMFFDCMDEITAFLSEGEECTEVYHVALQMFPLTIKK